MKKVSPPSKLHKPANPIISSTVLAVAAFLVILVFIVNFIYNPSSKRPAVAPITSTTSSPTPIPVDSSNWKTYTDWKYNFSIKLPPEFAGYRPTIGYTGDNPDPDGTGTMQFEDTTLSGSYPNRTAKYGFSLQLGTASNQAQPCTTDQECYNLLTSFYKNVPGKMEIQPIQAIIFNRNIKGLAVLSGIDSPTPSLYYFYNIAITGKRFSVMIDFYYPKSFQQAQTKDPIINAILSSISFAKQ